GQGQAVLLNSGNANACTGEQGMRDAREMARLAGEHLQMVEDLVYICSTGPIGVPLPMDAVRRGIPEAVRHLGADGTAAAAAILTFANGEAGAPGITGPGDALDAFQAALSVLTGGLARAIARDGEGATKLVEITVAGAQTEEDAERAARAVANSLLVKTSIHGAGAHWGRIMAAVGYSGVDVEPDRIAVKIGPVGVAEGGAGVGGP